MTNLADSLKNTFGALTPSMTTVGGEVHTTPVKVAAPTNYTDVSLRTVRVVNTGASINLAVSVELSGAATPTLTASGSGSADGILILPETTEVLNIQNNHDLWIVAAANSGSYNILVKWE